MENEHKDKVSRSIHDSRENEKIQWTPGIADCTQNAGTHVIEHEADYTFKIDAEIDGCFLEHVIWSTHQPQQCRGKRNCDMPPDVKAFVQVFEKKMQEAEAKKANMEQKEERRVS